MKVEDLIQLLNNRLREFKLSRDYAKMSGDLERMNTADIEVIALEDTLFKLNLLVDTSKSAAAKDATLAEVITDGSVAVLGEYDITPYATDPKHEEKILNILSKMGVMDTVEKIDEYIKDKYLSSPVTGEMVVLAVKAYSVDTRLTMAMMEQDSSFGTAGLAVRTLNPGNVGNDDDGNIRTYGSWQEGVTAVAEWLSRHRVVHVTNIGTSTTTPAVFTPVSSTSTPIYNTSTSTTSTTTVITTPDETATSTPVTSTTTTSTTATTTPVIDIPTEEASTTTTSTTTVITTPDETATSTPVTSTTTTSTTATTTPVIDMPTEEASTLTTSTTTVTSPATEIPVEVVPPAVEIITETPAANVPVDVTPTTETAVETPATDTPADLPTTEQATTTAN